MGTVFVKMWNENIQTVPVLSNETEKNVEDERVEKRDNLQPYTQGQRQQKNARVNRE